MRILITTILCLCLILTALSCSPSQSSQKTYEELTAVYGDIITQYTELLNAKYHGEELPAPNTDAMSEREAAIAVAIHSAVDRRDDPDTLKSLGYGYKDMDGNGTPELFLLNQYTLVDAVFTLLDGEPLLLESVSEKGSIIFASKNRIFINKITVDGEVKETTHYTSRVDGDRMVYDAVCGYATDGESNHTLGYFQIIGGERVAIDILTYQELACDFEKAYQPNYYEQKLTAPRIHFPLADSEESGDLPVADFSDYDAVKKTYQAIGTSLDQFTIQQFVRGDYDHLFSFTDDASFETYIRLLFSLRANKNSTGYDEIDLNGDGADELVFLDEDYRIRAIFTQKDGRPVLLGAFSGETCWLDDQGKIHVDDERYDTLEYTLYDLTKEGDLRLVYSILRTLYGTYLTKDGKTEKIISEEMNAGYYHDYFCYSEPFDANEQTRNISDLTYTPLSSVSEDLVIEALGKTWHKYAEMDESTGKMMARSNTYITFMKETGSALTVKIDYVFTFCYPDPEKDHYLLDDTTESSLTLTAEVTNGIFAFEENGVKGTFEFYHSQVWMVIEESTDERFPVGYHCYEVYSPDDYLS